MSHLMRKKYIVKLNNKIIGSTQLEKSDPSMGVVCEKLKLKGIDSGYKFFKNYCQKCNIKINLDDPEYRAIDTQAIT
jgi:hypothetical protein